MVKRQLPIGGKRIPPVTEPKKKRKSKSGVKILKEIRKLQNSTGTLIPRLSFQRVVKGISRNEMFDVRWTPGALEALQVILKNILYKNL